MYFEQSARLGYQLGFADMGFTYGLAHSAVLNPVLSYAWLTVAIERETQARLKQYLTASREKLVRSMNAADTALGQTKGNDLIAEFASIPVWSESR